MLILLFCPTRGTGKRRGGRWKIIILRSTLVMVSLQKYNSCMLNLPLLLEWVVHRKLNCLSGCFGNKFARYYCQPQKIMSTTSPTSHVQQVSLPDTFYNNNNNNDTETYNLQWRSRGGGAGWTTTDLSCVCFGIWINCLTMGWWAEYVKLVILLWNQIRTRHRVAGPEWRSAQVVAFSLSLSLQILTFYYSSDKCMLLSSEFASREVGLIVRPMGIFQWNWKSWIMGQGSRRLVQHARKS